MLLLCIYIHITVICSFAVIVNFHDLLMFIKLRTIMIHHLRSLLEMELHVSLLGTN